MNFSLGFPDPSQELSVAPKESLEAVVSHFQSMHREPDSAGARHPPPARRRRRLRRYSRARSTPGSAPRSKSAASQRLYSHQAEAFDHIQAGKHVVIVTPTASGKTLCYNLPVLNLLLRDPGARAMYLFPTKALAEDQLHEFQRAVDEMGSEIRAFTYDGDTPQDARRAIRQRANVVLTNPDMLHSGILPHHTNWARYFENLRYIVIDELHYYRGVYGSHLANLLRRLARICEFYGSKPQFICCSATIANPRELAEALTGEPFELVERNGAPRGEKYFIFYNPPVVNRQLGIRRSYIAETRRMALEFIEHNLQTLVFANNRLATEVLVTYLKDACDKRAHPLGDRARLSRRLPAARAPRNREQPARRRDPRRGGHQRARTRHRYRLARRRGDGRATPAPSPPPGSAPDAPDAARAPPPRCWWPPAPRSISTSSSTPTTSSSARRSTPTSIPTTSRSCSPTSSARPSNCPCATAKSSATNDLADMCRFLEETGFLHHSAGAWHWTSDTYPADATSLRSVSSDNFVVVDITGEAKIIAEVSFPAALTTLHEKAIYLHEARQYHVERFDYDQRKAYVKRVDCDYYTDAIDYTQVKVLEEFEAAPLNGAARAHGDVRVNRQIVGFKKIKFYTMENVGAGKLNMPEQEMHTTAFWLHFPAEFLARFTDFTPTEKQSGITGLGNALRTVAALLLMCDPRDLGIALSEEIAGGLEVFEPNLYLYDTYPGGVGQSAPLYRLAPELLRQTAGLLASCACEAGCPSCVGPAGETGERGKLVAAQILTALLA